MLYIVQAAVWTGSQYVFPLWAASSDKHEAAQICQELATQESCSSCNSWGSPALSGTRRRCYTRGLKCFEVVEVPEVYDQDLGKCRVAPSVIYRAALPEHLKSPLHNNLWYCNRVGWLS